MFLQIGSDRRIFQRRTFLSFGEPLLHRLLDLGVRRADESNHGGGRCLVVETAVPVAPVIPAIVARRPFRCRCAAEFRPGFAPGFAPGFFPPAFAAGTRFPWLSWLARFPWSRRRGRGRRCRRKRAVKDRQRRAQGVLDLEQRRALFVVAQRDSDGVGTGAYGPPDAMDVHLDFTGDVVVDHVRQVVQPNAPGVAVGDDLHARGAAQLAVNAGAL